MTAEESDADEAYDPEDPVPPERVPPLRRTAPQSKFTRTQVLLGVVVLVLGLSITFGVPLIFG